MISREGEWFHLSLPHGFEAPSLVTPPSYELEMSIRLSFFPTCCIRQASDFDPQFENLEMKGEEHEEQQCYFSSGRGEKVSTTHPASCNYSDMYNSTNL